MQIAANDKMKNPERKAQYIPAKCQNVKQERDIRFVLMSRINCFRIHLLGIPIERMTLRQVYKAFAATGNETLKRLMKLLSVCFYDLMLFG